MREEEREGRKEGREREKGQRKREEGENEIEQAAARQRPAQQGPRDEGRPLPVSMINRARHVSVGHVRP
ncbi:hypothetical protein C7B76_30420, partial [filamentous cyanobacterium CCP2]